MSFEYIFSAMPPLPLAVGERVALEASELARICGGEDEPAAGLARDLLMEFDMRALERIQMDVEPGETALFSEEGLRSKEGLPSWLEEALSDRGVAEEGYAFDRAWRAYYSMLFSRGVASGSGFLVRWVLFDAGLRKAIADHRAAQRGLEAPSWGMPGDAPRPPYDYRRVIDDLIAIKDRGGEWWRDADRHLAQVRLEQARRMSGDYSFDMDELLGYMVRFTVLKQGTYLS